MILSLSRPSPSAVRRKAAALMVATLVAGCGGGGDGASGAAGRDGSDGRSALVIVSAEAAGLNCAHGGSKVSAGFDTDGDRTLGAAEVSSMQYICNGRDGGPGSAGTNGVAGAQGAGGASGDNGYTGLVRTIAEAAGIRCAAGGAHVSVGLDVNRSGALDDNEVSSTELVCNGFPGTPGATGATGAAGAAGATGADGIGSLVLMTAEAIGPNCAAGGTRISAGRDVNRNAVLDAPEVSSVQYVCSGIGGAAGAPGSTGAAGASGPSGPAGSTGADGYTTLVLTSPEAPGANCAAGGVRVSAGRDLNRSGALDASEVQSSDFLCNGAAGTTGATGAAGATGADGIGSLVLMTAEAIGPNCATGGTRVSAGRDVNRDAVLDVSEVSSVQFVCSGVAGATGAVGSTGATGATGGTGAAGPAGAAGSDGFTTLVLMAPESAGTNCAAGGVKVSAGRDIDRSGVLDAGEVQASDFLCNGATGATGAAGPAGTAGATGATGATGAPGQTGAAGSAGASGLNSLIGMSAESAGANCSNGGARLDSGPDANGNGILDTAEISATRYACNGAAGATGATGATGASGANGATGATGAAGAPGANGAAGAIGSTGAAGLNGLVAIAAEVPGSNCTYGGQRIIAGLDSSGNGALEVGEVSTTTYVCNGAPGPGLNWTSSGSSGTSITAQANSGVLAANDSAQVVVTLPAAPAIGDILRVSGVGAGGWRVAQSPGQYILTRGLPSGGAAVGADWIARESSRNWRKIASSADGSLLAAFVASGQIYTSTDAGDTWTARESNRSWTAITSSADGLRLAATVGSGQIYTSTDAGVSWTARESNRSWTAITSSADGLRLAATVGSGQIYMSDDAGATWTARESNRNWSSITSSADGTRLVAGVGAGGFNSCNLHGQAYTSTDAGVTWTLATASPSLDWTSLASSSDGRRIVAAICGYGIYTSSDYGQTWNRRTMGGSQYVQVASSSDGRRLAATSYGGRIQLSDDFGVDWVERGLSLTWWGIASSADGSRLAATVSSGQIYTSAASGERTTTGPAGSISGGQYDSIELQYVGGGSFIVLSYTAWSTGGFIVQ